LKVDKDMF